MAWQPSSGGIFVATPVPVAIAMLWPEHKLRLRPCMNCHSFRVRCSVHEAVSPWIRRNCASSHVAGIIPLILQRIWQWPHGVHSVRSSARSASVTNKPVGGRVQGIASDGAGAAPR